MSIDVLIGILSTAFVLTHVLPSHPPVRGVLVARLGRWPYLGAYSAVSLAVYVSLIYVWWTHLHTGPGAWALRSSVAIHGVELVLLVAFGLVGAGAIRPAPSSMTAVDHPSYEVRGAVAVTRHPVFVGLALLAACHMLLNGWAGDLLFWGGHLVLAVVGIFHQDTRHGQRPEYAAFMRQTSVLPNPMGLARLGARGWVGFLGGAAAAVAMRWAHGLIWS